MKIIFVTLITSYTNLATLKLVKHSSVQTLFHFTRTLLIFRFVIASMGSWVFDVIECLGNFLCFSLSSRTSTFPKHSVLFVGVGLPRTVCAFVNLTRDNIIEQCINTFPETPRPNVIRTTSSCCFEKFRIKRYPNRPWLDYPLDLTKWTNHKIRKRKWT